MHISNNNWKTESKNKEAIQKLSEESDIPPILAEILFQRGIKTAGDLQQFLQIEKAPLSNPYLFYDMEIAVKRVHNAIDNNENITVFGDYDADGVTSTAIIMATLTLLGSKNHNYYIPNRLLEGYGPTTTNITHLIENNLQLLITVDTGVSACAPLKKLHDLGINCIITDHHQLGTELPKATAILHPERVDHSSPCQHLAGAGVALKFAQALLGDIPPNILSLAAIGTIADLVPLTEENRLIVYQGLKALKEYPTVGLSALLHNAKKNLFNLTELDISFALAPRLNSPGRLGNADCAVDLLLTTDIEEANFLALQLENLNLERRGLVEQLTITADEQIKGRKQDNPVIVASGVNWHKGVLGIVASKLVETFKRPALVCTINQETNEATCSARSIDGFNIIACLQESNHLLTHCGGHSQAAGLSCTPEALNLLEAVLCARFTEMKQAGLTTPSKYVDACVQIADLSSELIDSLERLRPFGKGNEEPRFLIKNAHLSDFQTLGVDGCHLRAKLNDNSGGINVISFNNGKLINQISSSDIISAVGTVSYNYWNDKRTLQLMLEDVCCDHLQIFDWRSIPISNRTLSAIPTDKFFILFSKKNIELVPSNFRHLIQTPATLEKLLEETATMAENIVLLDFPTSEKELKQILTLSNLSKIYLFFKQKSNNLLTMIPSRSQFMGLYAFIKRHSPIKKIYLPHIQKKQKLTKETLLWMLEVFVQLNFITEDEQTIQITNDPLKKQLSESSAYMEKKYQIELQTNFLLSHSHEFTNNIIKIISQPKKGENKYES